MDNITYDEEHRVAVCRVCGTCLGATEAAWTRHLRRAPHQLTGQRLKATVELLGTFDLRSAEELRLSRPKRSEPCRVISGLTVFPGYVCKCSDSGKDSGHYCTRRLAKMREHVWAEHGIKAAVHNKGEKQLWSGCLLQTYYTAGGLVDYFVVVTGEGDDDEREDDQGQQQPQTPALRRVRNDASTAPLTPEQSQLFGSLRKVAKQAARDIEEKAGHVPAAGEGRADREPWLVHTGFPYFLQGLRDIEIQTSFTLPKLVKAQVAAPRARVTRGRAHTGEPTRAGSAVDDGSPIRKERQNEAQSTGGDLESDDSHDTPDSDSESDSDSVSDDEDAVEEDYDSYEGEKDRDESEEEEEQDEGYGTQRKTVSRPRRQDDESDNGDTDQSDAESEEHGIGEEEDLHYIIVAVERYLYKAYSLVSDRSQDRMMTRQRALVLSDFAHGAVRKGKDAGFRPRKNAKTLVRYFRQIEEVLVL